MKTICVIDGQGGGIGSTIIRRIKDAMCESNAYLVEGDETRLLMEPVDTVAPAGGGSSTSSAP